jgi:hypothetical protein
MALRKAITDPTAEATNTWTSMEPEPGSMYKGIPPELIIIE